MAKHELKTWPKFFDMVRLSRKRFEIRKNDRNFQVGDLLVLREFEPVTEAYTGRELNRGVADVIDLSPLYDAVVLTFVWHGDSTEAKQYADSTIAHRWFEKTFGEGFNGRDFALKCPMADEAMADARAKLAEAQKATSKLIGSALAVRKRNTTEFMVGLAEDLNIAEASIGGSDQCKFNGDGFVVSRAAMPTGEAQDAAK